MFLIQLIILFSLVGCFDHGSNENGEDQYVDSDSSKAAEDTSVPSSDTSLDNPDSIDTETDDSDNLDSDTIDSDTLDSDELQINWPKLTIDQIGQPQLIGDEFAFVEGPVWDETNQRLLFSDINGDTIYTLTLPNQVEVFKAPSGQANGLAFTPEGSLLAAEHKNRRVSQTQNNQSTETLVDSYEDTPLNSPNDIAVRFDGTIYFTDPEFGLGGTPSNLGFMGLYRLTPKNVLILEGEYTGAPNGVALSPDEQTLYLAETFSNRILSFQVTQDGSLTNQQEFATMKQPDGMTVDLAGNLYAAGYNEANEPAVVIFNSDATPVGSIPLDSAPTNCALGGPNGDILFITARDSVYMVTVPVPGF